MAKAYDDDLSLMNQLVGYSIEKHVCLFSLFLIQFEGNLKIITRNS